VQHAGVDHGVATTWMQVRAALLMTVEYDAANILPWLVYWKLKGWLPSRQCIKDSAHNKHRNTAA
jgi:hypothetical protein